MTTAIFSATASMISSQLNVFAEVLTNDFYKLFINPNATDRQLLKTSRLFTTLTGAFLVIMAIILLESVQKRGTTFDAEHLIVFNY